MPAAQAAATWRTPGPQPGTLPGRLAGTTSKEGQAWWADAPISGQ